MDWKQVITADPQTLHGAVRFAGTRVPVTVVLDNLADGATANEILAQFPSLRPEHIPAALAYAADLARERVVPVPAQRTVKFKLDENLPELVCETLAGLGHDVHTVAQEQLSGAPDELVFQACVTEGRVLVTLDLDFADIRSYPPGTHAGIWILRPAKQTFRAIEALSRAGVRLAETERVVGQLWVIDEQRIRIRDA